MIKCSKCNTNNMDGAKYCRHCGAKLENIFGDILYIITVIIGFALLILYFSSKY